MNLGGSMGSTGGDSVILEEEFDPDYEPTEEEVTKRTTIKQ